eukprot:120548_1
MTDKNDNGHWFLCCSGFEIYGDLKYIAPNKIELPGFQTFKYQYDFDENGIIYAIGTNFGDDITWKNPYQKGLVGLKSSGMKSDSKPIQNLIGRVAGIRCLCEETPNAWWYIDFKDDIKIRPTNYTLRHYTSWNIEALRNWKFEGSNDSKNWECI